MNPATKISDLLKDGLNPGDTFYIDIRSEWGSDKEDYRIQIRRGILEFLKTQHPSEVADSVWDLNTPPVLKSFFVSISHCAGMGGFVFSSRPLGLDIEEKSRISKRIVERVSTPEELKACPTFELLWPTKEAIFKCSTEFNTIADIQVFHWEKSRNDTYAFISLTTTGWAFLEAHHSYAIAIKKL